ncbi:MAG: sigma-70 family RNA polymerase sigma factor [Candidatus Saccharibacteria bacterium]
MISLETSDDSRFIEYGEPEASSVLSGAIITGHADSALPYPLELDPDETGSVAEAISDEEFESCYRDYYPEVFGFLRKRGNKAPVAEDLTQEVFLRAFVNMSNLAEGSNYRAWIFQVTRNISIDHYRKDREIPFDPLSVPVREEISADPTEFIEEQEVVEAISIAGLTTDQVDLFEQVILGLQSPVEYARANNIDANALHSRLDRLRKRLQASVAEYL